MTNEATAEIARLRQALTIQIEAGRIYREQAEAALAEREGERDRAIRNRDMWKGQCERQAVELDRLREALTEIANGSRAKARSLAHAALAPDAEKGDRDA